MIPLIVADGTAEKELLIRFKARNEETDRKVTAVVDEIISSVRQRGDEAVREYTVKFDGQAPEKTELAPDEIESSLKICDPEFISALKNAAANIKSFHERQKQQSWFDAGPNGTIMGQRVRGLERVGIYVPGGTAAYPSSVLMSAIPAKIAGTEEIIMVTPPSKEGKANPNILAAAAISGVDRVFLCGGAQAVAALAYGTESIPKVDKIVGPGNIYVATAKRMLFGTVDIDMIAGPSEILIIADESANAKFVAADLMSQAEHDTLAAAILVTTSKEIAEKTREELERQVVTLSRKDIIKESLKNNGAIIVCSSLDEAVRIADEFAPEHLELCVKSPFEYLGRVKNAASIFLGHYTPESAGDYYAGPNHVLPTGGTARFFSPLSVESFTKKSGFICYSAEDFNRAAGDIITLAQTEGLTAHANSVKVRCP